MEEKITNTTEEVLERYGIAEYPESFPRGQELVGYRIIGTIEKCMYTSNCFITSPDIWMGKFKIITKADPVTTLILVSPECPEIYFVDPEDLIEFVSEYIEASKVFSTDALKDYLLEDISVSPGRSIFWDSGNNVHTTISPAGCGSYINPTTTTTSSTYTVNNMGFGKLSAPGETGVLYYDVSSGMLKVKTGDNSYTTI